MMLPTGVENPFVPNISFLRELSSLVWWLDLFFLTNIFRLTFAITLGLSLWLFFSLFPNSLASFKKDGLCVVFLYLFICLYYVQYAPVAGWLWRGLAGSSWRSWWNTKSTMSQWCSLVASWATLGRVFPADQRSWFLFLYSALLRHIWITGSNSGFPSPG